MQQDEVYDFGTRLKQLRHSQNLSQYQVAQKLDLNRATIGNYENNRLIPSVDVLIKLALLYRVSTDFILNLDHRKMIDVSKLDNERLALVEKLIYTLEK